MGAARLQKLIANAGLTSRRKAEDWIRAGRVSVDGETVTDLGRQADPLTQQVRVDGAPLPSPERVVLALHKPVGVVTSMSDPHADRIVTDLLGDDVAERVFPAGRLDKDSEGLVLMTNDGALMQAMTRPGGPVAKVYEVDVRGLPQIDVLSDLRDGATIDKRTLLPCAIKIIRERSAGSRYRVTLHEGKKNQIRRMFGDRGHRVQRLVRTSIGPIQLGSLPVGEYRQLAADEVEALWAVAKGEARL